MLLDKQTMTDILMLTSSILQKNFFYSTEAIKRFLDILVETIKFEYEDFEEWADDGLKTELKYDNVARVYFTSYFISVNLHNVMIHELHFTDMELEAFDNILPKYLEVADDANIKSRSKRANY